MALDPEGVIVNGPDPSARQSRGRRGRCPACSREVSWADNPQRPFCSLACRLIDLGLWLDERFIAPGEFPDDVR